MPVQVHHCPPCGHYVHKGTCPDCQRAALAKSKAHVVAAAKARARWEQDNPPAPRPTGRVIDFNPVVDARSVRYWDF